MGAEGQPGVAHSKSEGNASRTGLVDTIAFFNGSALLGVLLQEPF